MSTKTFKMKNIITVLFTLAITSMSTLAQSSLELTKSETNITISKEIYGHFSEHLGTCIYGGIYVGEDSEIPNIKGYRLDVIEAFKELKVPVLRWPGGCFADTYHWKDGIGPKQDRPSIVNVHWGGVTEDNSFGTHEFLDFCELIGTQPYLSINVGSGTVQEAAEWVEYVNSSNKSPMTDLRRKNGREEPWDVKYWGIGNENWGCGGEMTASYYVNVYRNYACYVKGNNLQRVICGPSDSQVEWTEDIMKGLTGKNHLAQGLSLHYYTLPTGDWSAKGSSVDFGEDMWFKTLKSTMRMEDFIQAHLKVMDKYDPEGRIKLMVDEWGTWYDKLPGSQDGFLQQQNTVRDALVAGINLNIFNNHADRISMANIAQIVNVLQSVILTDGPEMVKTPTYHVFKMYTVHQDATLVPLKLKSEAYSFEGEHINALSASASEKDGVVSITVTNANPEKAIDLDLKVGEELKAFNGQVVSGTQMTDYNDFGMEEKVSLSDFDPGKVKNGVLSLSVPSKSVVLIQLK